MRNLESYGAVIENNELVNVSDTNKFDNPRTDAPLGLVEPLAFRVGAEDEFSVNGAEISATANSESTALSVDPNGTRWSIATLLSSWLDGFSKLWS